MATECRETFAGALARPTPIDVFREGKWMWMVLWRRSTKEGEVGLDAWVVIATIFPKFAQLSFEFIVIRWAL